MIIEPIILIYILFAVIGVLAIFLIRLELRIRKLFAGKDAKSLEDIIGQINQRQHELERFRTETEAYLADVEKRLTRSIQGVKTIRFNPFKGTGDGGDQSFAAAFVNESGDGIVLSSLYARERTAVFAKPIENNTSHYALSSEEKEVLATARASLREDPVESGNQ